MHEASADMRAALMGSFTYYVRGELYYADERLATLPIIGGDLTEEKDAETRQRVSLTIPPLDEWIPANSDDLLFPSGVEVQLYAGVVFPSGTVEAPAIGRFRISKPKVSASGTDASLTIEGYDRSRTVARARFSDTYIIPVGADLGGQIQTILTDRLGAFPDLNFDLISGSTTARLVYEPTDTDPWQASRQLAAQDGLDIYFDGVGMPVLREEPDPATDEVVWLYGPGQGVVVEGEKEIDEEETYNWVIASSNPTDETVPVLRGEAFDNNPDSPTYIGGLTRADEGFGKSPFGAVPYFLTSDMFTTQDQVNRAARAQLLKVLGFAEAVTFSAPPNPLLQVDDAVWLEVPGTKVNGLYIVDSKKLPLRVDDGARMQVTCRPRRLLL